MLRRAFGTLRNVAMAKTPPKNPLIVVLGATGTGKSQVMRFPDLQYPILN
jgi:Tfp pilus assembly ATPase PilU